MLKGEVSMYHWPPVWLIWNQLFDYWQFLFYLQNRLIQTSQTGGQQYSDTSPYSIQCKGYHWAVNLHHFSLMGRNAVTDGSTVYGGKPHSKDKCNSEVSNHSVFHNRVLAIWLKIDLYKLTEEMFLKFSKT
jgi:hypothetical protein